MSDYAVLMVVCSLYLSEPGVKGLLRVNHLFPPLLTPCLHCRLIPAPKVMHLEPFSLQSNPARLFSVEGAIAVITGGGTGAFPRRFRRVWANGFL